MASFSKASPILTADQADALAQRRLKKHDIAIVLLHWFNATVWLLELMTGLALLAAPGLRVMPWWYINSVQGIFGTRGNMLRLHIAAGIAWIVVFAVYATFGFRTYLRKEVLVREMGLDGDDLRWLRIRALGILRLSNETLPPQGVYNAGQKMFAYLIYTMLPIIMITGLIMTFHWPATWVVGWAAAIHFAAVGAVVCGLMVHVYMGAVFPEEKPAFFSMITGSVDELYAYRHHFKWWSEVRGQHPESTERASAAECRCVTNAEGEKEQ